MNISNIVNKMSNIVKIFQVQNKRLILMEIFYFILLYKQHLD